VNVEGLIVEHYQRDVRFAVPGVVEPHAADTSGLIRNDFEFHQVALRVVKLAVNTVGLRIRQSFDLDNAADHLALPGSLALALTEQLPPSFRCPRSGENETCGTHQFHRLA
jgi:hypothetical protein